jgi:hypothetical protein
MKQIQMNYQQIFKQYQQVKHTQVHYVLQYIVYMVRRYLIQ